MIHTLTGWRRYVDAAPGDTIPKRIVTQILEDMETLARQLVVPTLPLEALTGHRVEAQDTALQGTILAFLRTAPAIPQKERQ